MKPVLPALMQTSVGICMVFLGQNLPSAIIVQRGVFLCLDSTPAVPTVEDLEHSLPYIYQPSVYHCQQALWFEKSNPSDTALTMVIAV